MKRIGIQAFVSMAQIQITSYEAKSLKLTWPRHMKRSGYSCCAVVPRGGTNSM